MTTMLIDEFWQSISDVRKKAPKAPTNWRTHQLMRVSSISPSILTSSHREVHGAWREVFLTTIKRLVSPAEFKG